ncbi:hypothetical protein [Zhongshania sp. BJYM1]|uniref:hypothetical protein n=1 Tax=Zhongshania aquatica TaxID=2965069 RepID=UPI0022B4C8E6|nr:hypothetical protein [Marortus sp. BJYM1]
MSNNKSTSEVKLAFTVTGQFTTIEFESHLKSLAGPKDFYVGLFSDEGNNLVLKLSDNSHQPKIQLTLQFEQSMQEIGQKIVNILTGKELATTKMTPSIRFFLEHTSHININDNKPIPLMPKIIKINNPVSKEIEKINDLTDEVNKGKIEDDEDPTNPSAEKSNDEDKEAGDTRDIFEIRHGETCQEKMMICAKTIDLQKGQIVGKFRNKDYIIRFDKEAKEANILPKVEVHTTARKSKSGNVYREIVKSEILKLMEKIMENLK